MIIDINIKLKTNNKGGRNEQKKYNSHFTPHTLFRQQS